MFLLETSRAEKIEELRRQLTLQAWMPWIITSIIVSILLYIASAMGLMKMFEKAGEKNWKAWIPVYNIYVLVKLCWNKKWFWPALGGCVFIAIFGNLRVANSTATVFAILIVLVLIALFVWKCFFSYFVAKKFSKGIPWVIGIILLDWLFYLFLGFGGSEFDGKKPEPKKIEEKKSPEKNTAKKAATNKTEKPKPAAKKKPVDYIDPKPKAKF